MGLVTSLVLGFVHLFMVAMDILFLLLLAKMLSYRWETSWLTAINAMGKPALDWLTGHIETGLGRIGQKIPSRRTVLFMSMLIISIARLAVVVSLRR